MRVVHLKRPIFHITLDRYAPRGSAEYAAVTKILAQFGEERCPLPGPQDHEDLIPPTLVCMARPVPTSAGLVVCYAVKGEMVHVIAIKPPARDPDPGARKPRAA